MKKTFFITLVGIAVCMAGFVSCSNDDFGESLSNVKQSKTMATRSVNSITMEEVLARVNELNEKYNSDFVVNQKLPAEKFDEQFFLLLENLLRRDNGLEPLETTSVGFTLTNAGIDK